MTIIADGSVLREDYVPSDLRHRHGVLEELSTALDSLGPGPGSAFLHGPTGAGKTVCAQFISGQLKTELPEIEVTTLECSSAGSRWSILYQLLRETGAIAGLSRSSDNHHDLLQRLREEDRPRLVLLDEVDSLEDVAVLADLLSVDGLGLLCTAHEYESFVGGLDRRLRSRIQSRFTVIAVERYSTAQLVGILDDRVQHGLGHAVIEDEQVERIAQWADGSARLAISILRKAALRARDDDADAISDAHIVAAVPPAKRDVRRTSLSKLNPQQLLLYRLVYQHGPIRAGDLHERYAAASEDPVCERTRRNYLSKLGAYGLIDVDGDNRWRTYRLAEPAPDPL